MLGIVDHSDLWYQIKERCKKEWHSVYWNSKKLNTYINAEWQISLPYGSKLHIPPTNYYLQAAQEQQNTEEYFEKKRKRKKKMDGPLTEKRDKTEQERRQKRGIKKHLTALRFQTGIRH